MIPLHVHSFYSPLAGMNSPEEICAWASHHQLPAIALTDTNALYGMVHFREVAEKYNLIPLIGSEVLSPIKSSKPPPVLTPLQVPPTEIMFSAEHSLALKKLNEPVSRHLLNSFLEGTK